MRDTPPLFESLERASDFGSQNASSARQSARQTIYPLLSAKELFRQRMALFFVGIIILVLGLTPYFGPIIGFGENETTGIFTVLSFGNHAGYDEDNDGIAALDEVIDFQVNASFGWSVAEQHLAAWWRVRSLDTNQTAFVCNGAETACTFVGASASSGQWNDPLYVYYGRHGATENNTVGVQILYVNYSLDISNLSAEVYNSEWETLPAIFLGGIPNYTLMQRGWK